MDRHWPTANLCMNFKKKKIPFLLRVLLFSWVSQPLKMGLISAGIFAWKVKNPTPRIILLELWVLPAPREEPCNNCSLIPGANSHTYIFCKCHPCNPCWGTQSRPEYLFLALLPVEYGIQTRSRPSVAPEENHHLVKKKKKNPWKAPR